MADINEKIGQAMRLRPTLVVGAGGTGYETVVRMKARFQESFPPELLQQVRYVCFDTDTNHPPVRNSLGEMVYMEPQIELFQIGGVPVKGIIDNQKNYPEIAHELELKKLPRLDLTKGAKQVRQLGRLAFFYHFQRIRKVFETALRDVLNIGHFQSGSSEVQAINCFFISSVCGGTGSGVIIDLAYLVRHLANKWGIPIDFIFSTGVLVLPEAFTKVPASNEAQIRANASATLAEIDHFMTYGDFNAHYPDNTRVIDSRPPFSITYLVDASNERNQTVEDLTQLTPVLAEALFLQAGSYLGASVDSAFDNIPTSTSQDINGYLKSYSMVGASTLRFNATRIRNACAFRLMREMVQDVFLKETADSGRAYDETRVHSAVADSVDAFIGSAHLTMEQLRQQMRIMPGQEQMIVNLNTEMFDRVPPQAIVRRVENAVSRYGQDTVNERFLTQVEQNRQRLADDASKMISQYADTLVDRLDAGIPLALAFLDGVVTQLGPLRTQLQAAREDARAQLGRGQKAIERSHEAFEQGAQAFNFWGLRKKPLQEVRRRYTEQNRRYQQQVLEQGIATQGLALLEAIEMRAQRMSGLINGLKANLEQISNDADRDAEVLLTNWRPNHVTEEIIDDPSSVERFYQRYINETASNEARELAAGHSLSHWLHELYAASDSAEQTSLTRAIEKWMRDYAFERFSRIEQDETVEKQIQDLYTNDRDRRNRLQSLISKGAPFCNYETTSAGQGSDDLDQILVVGVRDKNTSIFSGVQLTNASLVSTFDNFRISVLYTKHGLPLYGLRQYATYKKHFTNQMARSRAGAVPLFGFKSVQLEMTVRTWYTQAEAFGVIRRQGSSGYILTVGEDETHRLGEGLRQSLEKMVSDHSLHQPMRKAIAAWLEQNSHEQAMEALTAYMNAERRTPMPLHDELVMIAQSEYDRHARLARA